MKTKRLLKHLRKLFMVVCHGRGEEFFIVRARRNEQLVIVAWEKDRKAAMRIANLEGQNFVSINRVYVLNFNQQ